MAAPFWKAGNQVERLAELIGRPADLKEEPLRRDVRSLGRLLGEVIKEQAGEDLFNAVEQLRRISIEERSAQNTSLERAAAIVREITVENAYKLTRAFSIYFELTNLAETNHRKRRR